MKKITKLAVVRFLYSIKGWFKSKKLKKGCQYLGGPSKCMSIYRGDRLFYEQYEGLDPYTGVQVFATKNKKYPYWVIGLFKWSFIRSNE